MAQEENILGCGYSGGGMGRGGGGDYGSGGGISCSRPKKIKQKKVPQRGLGVAQLEKIRLEEQRKKESLQAANILAKNIVASPGDASPFLAVQKIRSGFSSFHNSVPLPPPSSSDLPLPFRHAQSVANIEIRQESPVQISKQSNAGGGEIDSRAVLSPGNEKLARLWCGEYNLAGEKLRLDHHGFAFDPQVNLSYKNNPVLHLPIVPQRSHQFQQPSPSSSMLQVDSSSWILPSSLVSSQMEPPSNQSFRGNNYATLWTEEDKMCGMKRSYPFSLESPSAPSSHCNFHLSYAASSSKSDDLALCSNGQTAHAGKRNKGIRGLSNSSPLPGQNPNVVNRDDGRLNGDFLTLAPPSVSSPPLSATRKRPFDYSGHQEEAYECKPSQEYTENHIHQPGSSGSVEHCFTFFPTSDVSNGNGEKGETIDLNLKL